MIGSSMRLLQILFFSLCVTTTLFSKCQSLQLAFKDDSKNIAENDVVSRISIEHDDLKHNIAHLRLRPSCEIGDDVTYDCWNKYCSSLQDKHQSFTIKFKTPFSGPPKVMVGLKSLDVSNKYNVRVKATANQVTAKGFRLIIKSWADTYIYMAKVNWIACGPTDA